MGTVLVVSSLILAGVGLTGLVLSFLTLAPNVFDPVIAWTYFNPYLSGVPYGNPLNISDRYIFLRMQLLGWGQSATLLTV